MVWSCDITDDGCDGIEISLWYVLYDQAFWHTDLRRRLRQRFTLTLVRSRTCDTGNSYFVKKSLRVEWGDYVINSVR